jgi:hypothetical protein
MVPNNNFTPVVTYVPSFYDPAAIPVPVSVTLSGTQITIPKQHDSVTSSFIFTVTAAKTLYYRIKALWSPVGSLVSINASEGQLKGGESTDITLTVTSPIGIFSRANFTYELGVFADGYNGKCPLLSFTQVEEK